MSLRVDYPELFEQLWQAYPKWPKGRSVKQASFKKWQTICRELKWGDAEKLELVQAVRTQKLERASWQEGHTYGPQGLQVWLNQYGWQAEYETVAEVRKRRNSGFMPGSGRVVAEEPVDRRPPWEQQGITQEAYEAKQQRAYERFRGEMQKIGMMRKE